MLAAEFFAVVANPGLTFSDKLAAVLRVGCDSLGFEMGILARISDPSYEVVGVHCPSEMGVTPGMSFELAETYCREALRADSPIGFDRAEDSCWSEHPAYHKFGLESYLGTPVRVGAEVFGTLNFSSRAPRSHPVDQAARQDIANLALWIGYEMERQDLLTRLRGAQVEAEEARDQLQLILDAVPSLVWYKDVDSRVVKVNAAVATAMGVPKHEIEGRTTEELHPDEADAYLRDDRRVIEGGEPLRGIVEKVMMGPADERWVTTDKIPIAGPDGVTRGLLVMCHDVTRLKQTEETLRIAVEHDPLTGLANRETFTRGVSERLACADARPFAVCMLDFDRFKAVNDSLGHHAGDLLLKAIAGRLENSVKSGGLVARFGGDEFALLLRDVPDAETAHAVAERVRGACEHPYGIQGHAVVSTASIGLAHSGLGFGSTEEIIAAADQAMYQAKSAGRNLVRSASREGLERERERQVLGERLRAIVAADGLETVYQPIISADRSVSIGAELLVRWPGGAVPTGELISVANESEIVFSIARFVVREALSVISTNKLPGQFVAVKLGSREILHPSTLDFLRAELDRSRIEPGRLVLEIDERTYSAPRADHARAIRSFKQLGLRTAVEKFGMGTTSLSELQQMPVDFVKLDRRLLAPGRASVELAAVARALVDFARQLGITVIAEGVETEDQLAMLSALEIEYFQGHLASRPLPLAAYRAAFAGRRAA